MVAFPHKAAGKLGVNLKPATSTASTADGTRYPITLFWLKRLEIGSCTLRNVEAMIVAAPMPEPLLGMSALLRMNVEMSDGKMSLGVPGRSGTTGRRALIRLLNGENEQTAPVTPSIWVLSSPLSHPTSLTVTVRCRAWS